VHSAFEAELQALTYALHHLIDRRLHRGLLELETDCLNLVEIIKGHRQPPWELRSLVDEAAALLVDFPNLTLQHCYRDANLPADWAARAHNSFSAHDSFSYLPQALLDLVLVDASLSGCNISLS